ncbi:MAG: RDD family protein [Nocardioides sp.]
MTEQPPPPPMPEPTGAGHQPAGVPPPMPEPTGAGHQPAGVPRPGELVDRFLARLIDGVGFAIIYGVLYTVFAASVLGYGYGVGAYLIFALLLNILATLIYIGYYAYFESTSGATFGKQLMKLKVVGPDGVGHPTMEQAARRSAFQAVGLLGIIPIVGFFVGPLASLAAVIFIAVGINNDPVNRQGWHDKFAGGTKVLKIG